MNKADIRKEATAHLAKIGLKPGQFLWQPALAQVMLVLGGEPITVKLKSGMSRRAFSYEMGRIAGLVEAYGIKARALNGHAPALNGSAPYATPAG